MTMRARTHTALLLMLAVVACRDPLLVENLNNPETERVFATPEAIEAAVGSSYQVCRNNHNEDNLYQQLLTMSGESFSGLNNFSMGPRSAIPRPPILNNKSANQAENGRFAALQRGARFAANAIGQLDRLAKDDPDGIVLPSADRDRRARAIGFFGIACNLGMVALAWDSAASLPDLHTIPTDSVPPLKDAHDVAADAIAYLDSAINLANNISINFEDSWFSGNALSPLQFRQLMHSWKARIRAQVARTPAERAAVNWQAVIADAEAGITEDLVVEIGGSTGWDLEFNQSTLFQGPGWGEITWMYYGMADVGGEYASEILKPYSDRRPILIVTPDLRWPQGQSRAEQIANSTVTTNHRDFPYINARASDPEGAGFGSTWYTTQRYRYIRNSGSAGPYPDFLKAEVDMLAAEGYIRTGQYAQAAAKIDIWRTRAGLPAISGVVLDGDDPVPGGPMCVPKVPQPPDRHVVCGNIMEAMKYEYRMELAYNVVGAWFYPGRGWGDLIPDTPLEYPVPVQELDSRLMPYYNLGGGGPSSHGPNTYGFP